MPEPEKNRSMMFPMLRGEASVVPGTLDDATRTVDLTFYSGADIVRYSFMDGRYMLRFSMKPDSVRLARMNAGAPLLAVHNQYELDSILGVVEKAWIENGKGRATVRFSQRPQVDAVFADVKAGIIRNVSMGAVVHQMKNVTQKGDAVETFEAIDWEPIEVSLVGVPADAGAQTMAHDAPRYECLVLQGDPLPEEAMKETSPTQPAAPAAPIPAAPAMPAASPTAEQIALAAQEGAKAERERISSIRKAVKVSKLSEDVAERLILGGQSVAEAQSEIFRLMAEESEKTPTRSAVSVGSEHDALPNVLERMSVALGHRASQGTAHPVKLTDEAREFAGISLVDCASEILQAHRVSFPRRDKARVVELALNLSTSDFPGLLANVANKILQPAYQAANPTYRMLAARHDLPDFKTASWLKAGDFPVPLQVGEGGEIKFGSFSESKDTYSLLTYGRRVAFTRQAMINDDLGAFGRVMGAAGLRIADFENATFFTLLISASGAGPTLGDTGALFNATAVTTAGGHANLTSSGTAISVDSLGIGRATMQKQVGLDGIKLNILPRFLLTSPDKRTLAEQYTSSAYVPNQPSVINPFSGKIEVLSDANLVTANPWYLFADPSVAPTFVYGYLSGSAGVRVETRLGFEIEGVEMKVAVDFGTAAVDFRGAYRNAGA